jgi:predicted HicB family RNase H-like nuclease
MLTSNPEQEGGEPVPEQTKRMNLNVPASLHDAFKAATAAKGTTMTKVLMQHIDEYVSKHGVTPKKKTGRS